MPENYFEEDIEELAKAVHEYYRQLGKREGWTMEYDMAYADLSGEIRGDNVAAARRIPEVLSHPRLSVVIEDDPGPVIDVKVLEDNMEILAEAEHNGWMNHKLNNGWSYGKSRNDSRKTHNLLILYKELSEKDKEKDRNSVRSYPEIVKMAGYKIVHSD
jgi:hypothetical protein